MRTTTRRTRANGEGDEEEAADEVEASPREITPPKYSQHWDPIKLIFESN